MALNSLDAVKRRIQALQQQADEAEDRAQLFQRELDEERDHREKVRRRAFFLLSEESTPLKDSLGAKSIQLRAGLFFCISDCQQE